MKVLHLSSEKSWRGGEQQIAYLIEQSREHGVISMVACRAGSAFESYCIKNSILYFSLPFSSSLDISTAYQVAKICRHHQIDLIHMHSGKSHMIGVMSHYFNNSPMLILSRRVDFPVRNSTISKWKYNHPSIKKIICVSNAIEEILRSSLKKPEICSTIHSGIDLNRFRNIVESKNLKLEFGVANNHWLVGNTSALADHKDYFTFVDVAKLADAQKLPITFIIIGDGPQNKPIQQYIKKNKLNHRIILTGFKKDIPNLLPSLDLFLMTSKTEGLGTSILDAFACKVPVVATAAGGIPEMVIHEKTGLLSPVGNAANLLKNIQLILNSPAFTEKIKENAFQLLTNKFTKEKMAQNTYMIYQEICK